MDIDIADISEAEKLKLDKRIKDIKNNPNEGIEWDLVKKKITGKIDIKE